MRLLLTSAGVTNAPLRAALAEMIQQPFGVSKVVFVTTAATAQSGHHDWLVQDINQAYALGWSEFNVLEINGLPRRLVVERLNRADVVYVTGGNAYHLAASIVDNGLADDLADLLNRTVYVGASAGSMIFTRRLSERLVAMYGADDDLYQQRGRRPVSPFDLFDWWLRPHVRFDSGGPAAADDVAYPLYLLDDDSAVRVIDDRVDVVSGGAWAYRVGMSDPGGKVAR